MTCCWCDGHGVTSDGKGARPFPCPGCTAQGTSAFGQDAQRLEAKPAGPVAEGHAPNHDILKGDAGQPNKRGATSHDASGKGIE